MKKKLKCWDFFQCNEEQCPVYKLKELKCWLIAGTHCRNEIQGTFLDKIEMCLECESFKANMDLDSMEKTLKVVNRQFTRFREMVDERDRELESTSMELALGLSEVFEALKQISLGDPSVSIPETSSLELIVKLKHMVNLTAENLAEIVNLSHEFAIGLAEHFDALHNVSKGDLTARVSGTSQVELLESLKEVTNHMIESVSREMTERKRAEDALQKAHHELEIRVEERTAELSRTNVLLKQEIAERKHAEEALQESEERYRTLFEESRDAIYMTTRKGRFVDVNQSCLDLFGCAREEMMGLDIKEMCVHPDDKCWCEQEIEERGSVRDFEVKFRKKNGTQMDCLLTATLRRANDGSIIGEQGIIRDMTDRKRLEAQLRQAQKMEALGRLAAGVAHEINNPLTIILTSAMLIEEDIDRDDPNFEGLETIANETVRCRNIVSSLLDFARQTRSAKGEHHLNDIVIESMRLTQKKADFKDVAVTHDLSEDIPIISVDKNQILQCFVNLALNAIEATDSDGKITVATRFLPLDELIEVAISDTGKGIAEYKMDKIFEPFFTTKEGGTGLGLAITRGIIEQHDGTIDVKSEPGHGTTFTIRLPVSKMENDTRAK